MAAEYYLYNTNYDNTLVDRSETSFAPLPPNSGEIFIDYFIPNNQPLYYYRESGGTIIINSENVINEYLINNIDTPEALDSVNYNTFTGYTGTTNIKINDNNKYAAYGTGTGLISGGTLSINGDNTKFDIAPARLLFIDQYTDPNNPVIEQLYYTGATGVTPAFLNTKQASYISIDRDFNINQNDNILTPTERRDEINIGIIIHNNLTNINAIDQNKQLAPDIMHSTYDVIDTINAVKFDEGNQLLAYNNSLQIRKTEGKLFKRSSGYEQDIKNPNIKTIPESSPATVFYRDITGGTTSGRTELITNEYELVDGTGTGSTIVTITGSTSQTTVQRVFLFESGKIVIQRGQNVYNTIEDAVVSFLNEDFVYEFNTINDAILIGCIALTVDCVDLSTRSKSAFISVDRYGSIIGATNSGFYTKKTYKLIKQLDDFPTPIDKNIYLQDKFTYEINGNVNINDNKIVLGENNVLKGQNYNDDLIIGSGDTIICSSGNTLNIDLLGLYNTNPTGSTFDCVKEIEGNTGAFLRNMTILSETIGNIYKYPFVYINQVQLFNTKNGFNINNSSGGTTVVISDVYTDNIVSGGTLITITGDTYNGITIKDSVINIPSGTTGAYILPSSAMTVNYGSIRNVQLVGDGIPLLGGLTKADRQWKFLNNLNADDSVSFGYISIIFNQNETTINNTSTYYKANVDNDSSNVERFTTEGLDNRLTYSGRTGSSIEAEFIATGGIEVDANNQSILIAVFKNGVENLSEVEVTVESSGSNVPFTVIGTTDLSVGEYLEIFVRNLSSTNNITLVDSQFKVSKI